MDDTRTNTPINFRKVFARGFFEGLRKAGIEDVDAFMNAKKMQAIERGLSHIATKILAAVPRSEAWGIGAIGNEVLRQSGGNYDKSAVARNLNELKESGLIREPLPGKFIRIPIKEVVQVKNEDSSYKGDFNQSSVPVLPPAASKREETAIDRLASIAKQLRNMANDIEDIGMAVEESAQQFAEKTAKLRQFQELLKSLGA